MSSENVGARSFSSQCILQLETDVQTAVAESKVSEAAVALAEEPADRVIRVTNHAAQFCSLCGRLF